MATINCHLPDELKQRVLDEGLPRGVSFASILQEGLLRMLDGEEPQPVRRLPTGRVARTAS